MSRSKLPQVVELIRVSTPGQVKADTPDAQRRVLAELRETRPGKVIREIRADAVSGALRLEDTPEGRELQRLAATGFDELRVADIDRVFGSRADDPRDRFGVWTLIREAGILLVDEFQVLDPKDPDDERRYYERTYHAKIERAKILKRTRRGRKAAAARGNLNTRPKYGFRRELITCGGSRKSSPPVVDPKTAPVVHRIFALRSEGLSYNSIAERLLAEQIPSPTSVGIWPFETLRGMLLDPAYRGEYHHDGSVIAVDPIIEPELWRQVQALRATPGRKATSDTLCRGLVRCECGEVAYTYPSGPRLAYYYGCRTLTLPEFRCPRCGFAKRHRRAEVDEAVWQAIVEVVTDPGVLRGAQDAEQGDDETPGIGGYQDEVDRCQQLLDRLTRDEIDLGREYRRRLISSDAWMAQQKDIARERRTLESSIDLARKQITAAEKLTHSARLAGVQLDELRARILRAGPQDRRAIIEAVIPKQEPYGIILHHDGRIEIRGVLAIGAASARGGGRKVAKVQRSKSTTHAPNGGRCTGAEALAEPGSE